jgi:preprotein translocase subunit YajC
MKFTESLAMFGPAEGAGQTNPLTALLPFVIIFAIFYFLVFRPESMKRKKLEKMIAGIEKGDKITTTGGLLGIVTNVKENAVTAKIAENVKVDIVKSAISRVEKKKEISDENSD